MGARRICRPRPNVWHQRRAQRVRCMPGLGLGTSRKLGETPEGLGVCALVVWASGFQDFEHLEREDGSDEFNGVLVGVALINEAFVRDLRDGWLARSNLGLGHLAKLFADRETAACRRNGSRFGRWNGLWVPRLHSASGTDEQLRTGNVPGGAVFAMRGAMRFGEV